MYKSWRRYRIQSNNAILNTHCKNIKDNDRKLVHSMVRRSFPTAKFYNAPLWLCNSFVHCVVRKCKHTATTADRYLMSLQLVNFPVKF